MILWDSTDVPLNTLGHVYTWNDYRESTFIHSLFRYVEANSMSLRCKYLSWIHDLGEYQVGPKRIIDHMAIDDGLTHLMSASFVKVSD